jgi:hypothetical protein
VLYAAAGAFGGFTTSSVSGAFGGGHFAPPGTMVFLDTTKNTLRISQNLDFADDSTPRFTAVTVDNGATLTLGGGSLLTVDEDFVVTENSLVIARAENSAERVNGEWRGTGVKIQVKNARIDAGSTISADAQGYSAEKGPGVGVGDAFHPGGGAGYGGAGGAGGDAFNAGGPTYGSLAVPLDLGSGGGLGRSVPGVGGGAIALYALDNVVLDGTISAGGTAAGGIGCSLTGSGGGSGGSILVATDALAGLGSLHADGGHGGEGGCTGGGDDGGGGGGGRVAIYFNVDAGFSGLATSSAAGGYGGMFGAPGTVVVVRCIGDCNADGRVAINELIRMVAIALGDGPVTGCIAGDERHDGRITINEIVRAVNNALFDCAR